MERKVCLILDARIGGGEAGRGLPWWISGKESAQNPPINAGGVGSTPASERFLEEGNRNPPQYFWKIPWTEESGRLQSMRSQRVTCLATKQ